MVVDPGNSPILDAPYLGKGQASAHISVNETLDIVETICSLKIVDRTSTTPPGTPPTDGSVYIVAATATGDWAGHEDEIAYYRNAAWLFIVPKAGMCGFCVAEDLLLYYTGSEWRPAQTIPHSLTEVWTGRYDRNGSEIYSKTIVLGSMPSGGIKYVNHGISNIDLAKRVLMEGWYSDGATLMHILGGLNMGINCGISLTPTQCAIGSNFSAGSYSGEVRLEYCKSIIP